MPNYDISEFLTRKKYIDKELKKLGWTLGDDCITEVPLIGMPNDLEIGFADYVLYGNDGLPLAVVEAKRTSKDPTIGTHQAKLYADCLEKATGRRPAMFTTNGFETHFWDDLTSPQRKVSGIFSKSDLQKFINRRNEKKDLTQIKIDDKITDRYYQKAAITSVCESISLGHRKHLLVMATGTGKTRTASSLTDVLSRGNYITNTLFLADRTALVSQAKDDFKNYLPHMSLCNLLSNKDDKTSRIIFSTYPTMLNSIDKKADGKRIFTPAHFDLIIIDEAHRSIFKKYKAIFDYFDGYLVGLTATPKTEVDRNTYEFFEIAKGNPTYSYDYYTAVYTDKVLVPYHNIEVKTKFLYEGILYADLSPEDKDKYEEDFTDEDGLMPIFIPSPEINTFIFNQGTVDMVLQDLMEKGLKVESGDKLGKTIIFAQSKEHAKYIVERFNKLYPHLKGGFIKRVVCGEPYAQKIIDEFKIPDKNPQIAVSVDMLDTGIDVPEILNLVFFKKIRSKTKFWQMIGRGTRLCKNIFGDNQDKKCFYIFDYLSNFEFFREKAKGIEGNETQSLSEAIFIKKIKLIEQLQHSNFMDFEYQEFRKSLINDVLKQIKSLNTELVSVKLQLRYIEMYNNEESFIAISEKDKSNLIKYIAPLVFMEEKNEVAKRFDNFMYGAMLAQIEQSSQLNKARKQLINIGVLLQKKFTVPQVKEKSEIIKHICEDVFWENANVISFENVRIDLRELIKYIIEDSRDPVYTNLLDPIIDTKEGEVLKQDDEMLEYKTKVNKYIEEHKNHPSIHKLRNNIPITDFDYKSLESILTGELGSIEDYKKEFGDTPFGILIRKIAKLENEAVLSAFSDFISDQSLNQYQIVFVKKIIDYITQNGYVDSIADFMKPPFDKPQNFIKLFDGEKQKKLMNIINSIKDNALKVV